MKDTENLEIYKDMVKKLRIKEKELHNIEEK